MKRLKQAALIVSFALMMSLNFNIQAKAATEEDKEQEQCQTDVSVGGMSALINDYYDEILSEKGISVSNVVTTLSVGGSIMEKVDRTSSLYSNLALANVNDYVNIRDKATTDGEIVGRLYANAVANVVETKGEWTKISSGKVDGYIKTEYLKFGEDAVDSISKNYTKFAKATCTTLNIREDAGTEYSKIGTIAQGEELEIIEELDEWVKVKYGTQIGYVSKNYVDYTYEVKYAMTIADALKLDEKKKYDANHMIWPLPSDHSIHTYFGYRKAPTKGASTYHKGLDIGGRTGANVVAVLSGTVTAAQYSSSAGNYVEIDHGNGLVTRYLHNSKLLVRKGQKVSQGDVISLCGSTGISTGAHLHFSVVKNGSYVDPYPYLKNVH
ncbi:MAG: peptidoglycan DD-metalloendopeptidase family protein [Clostridiales bacterium]|nr:peptidoglycan DD-metalloendopeptidase family protein [Clostridiales bacterium]